MARDGLRRAGFRSSAARPACPCSNDGVTATAAEPRRPTRRIAAWVTFALVFAALSYTARFAGGEEPKDVAYRYSTSVAAVIQYGLILGILLLIAYGLPKQSAFGLWRPSSWPRALGYALVALLTIWAVAAILSPFLDATDEQGLVPDKWEASRAGAFAAFFVVVAVVAPVVEELTFRGLGFFLLWSYGRWPAIVLTGILFGMAHGLLLALPVLAVFGIAVGWVRDRTRSVYPGMILHGTFNGVALLASVLVTR
jgi:membrane protease YdiL (CAAX protease family)